MEDITNPSADKRAIGIKFGLISAVIGIVYFLILVFTVDNVYDQKWNWIPMVISITLIVLAHRAFKEDNGGFMTYGEGVSIGFWMMLVSIVVDGLFRYVYSTMIDPAIMDRMADAQYLQMQERGMSDEQIEMAVSWTKKLFWPIFFVIGPVFGMITVLIVTIFTQKRPPEQRI